MLLTAIMEGISKVATVLSVLMKVFTIPCHERGYTNVMLVLQSCTDSVQVRADPSVEPFPTSSDCKYDIGNMKVEEDIDMQEEGEVNVKTEKEIFSEEEECIDIKDEEGIYTEEEEEEEEVDTKEEEEDIGTKEDEDVDIKEEVSCEDTL
jgi:hypothetical protein